VRLISLRDGDAISSVTKIKAEEVEETTGEGVDPVVDETTQE
jgi:hypothetical protein